MTAISRKLPKTTASSRKFQHDRGIASFNSSTVGITIGGCPVGNALRGVPGPAERHGVRSLQNSAREVLPRFEPCPRNCRQRCASNFANWTYIAGYAPSSLFRAGLSPAWTSIAKGLKSSDLRTGEKLAEKTGVSREIGRQRESPTGWR